MAVAGITTWTWPAWAISILAAFEDEPQIFMDEIVDGNETVREYATDAQLHAMVRVAMAVGVFAGLMAGCAAHAPAPEAEMVGALAAGPSIRTAPLAHDEPPGLGVVVDTGDDIPTKPYAAERADGAPETAGKGGGITAGGAR